MLTYRQALAIVRGFTWSVRVPSPFVRMGHSVHTATAGVDGLHAWEGMSMFHVVLQGYGRALQVTATTPESALCQAVAAWGREFGDPCADQAAKDLRRRLAN